MALDRRRWGARAALLQNVAMCRLVALTLTLALIAAPLPLAAQEPYVLQPGHMDLEIGPDGNTVIFDAAEGLVVVDTGRHRAHSQAILDHAVATGKSVAALVNTHWHLDHTTGNRDILAAHPQARLVASNAVAQAMEGFLARSLATARDRLADPATPADQRARIERGVAAMEDRAAMVPAEPVPGDGPQWLGGREFELHIASAAATQADLWLVAPDEQVAVVGDLVVAPVPFFDSGCEDGWRAALAAIDAAQWTTLIPGHGAPMTRSDFARWRGAFSAWLDCAGSEAPAAVCADGWMRDAGGFYTEAEREGVRYLAEAYVAELLRLPVAQRESYCRAL